MYKLPKEKLELTDEVRNYILDTINGFSHNKIFEIYGKYFHCFSDIFENSSFPMEEVIYVLKHGRPEPCEYGNVGKFKKHKGYNKFCDIASKCKCKKIFTQKQKEIRESTNLEKYGVKNTSCLKKVKEKREKTNLKKYGSTTPFGSKEIQEKSKITVLNKYGVEYTGQIPSAIEKRKKTCIEKYGHHHPWKSKEIREKIKNTNLNKLGHENPFGSKIIQDKIKKTVLDKYDSLTYAQSEDHKRKTNKTFMEKFGVDHHWESPEIRNKSKQTFLEKYGVEYPLKSREILEKVEKTNLIKYGVMNPTQKNFTEIGRTALFDPLLLQEYLDQYSVYELQEIFGCECTAIYNRVNQYNLSIPVRNGSSYENVISNILTENNIVHIRHDKTIIPPREIDIFIPSVNLAIEINGLYWHSDKFKDNKYHYNKWNDCKENGIQLLSIFEDEIVDRPNTWISKILHICNSNSQRIHARKCQIVELSKNGIYDFVEKYHLQGFAHSKHYYGAFYDNELVAMMSFSNTRNNKEIQMNRFCLKNGVIITGIANRLLKAFVNDNPEIDEIVTYSDNRYSDGGIYEKMGFEKVHNISPDYTYIKGMSRFHKSTFKKDNIAKKFDIDMTDKTEREAMEELGFLRIYDCGKIKWKWKR